VQSRAQIIAGRGYSAGTAEQLETWAHTMRSKIEENALRVILSMRTLLRLAQAIEVYGQAFETAIEKEFLGRLETDTRELLR
jgi:hypothetical protein